jgi:hypothetical protein
MNTGQTWDKLTAEQLDGAAHDLRNAALVIKHSGHFKGALCDENTGQVCIVGAIDLATYRRMVNPNATGGYYALPQAEHIESGTYRAENAIIVMASFIPTTLCDDCDDDKYNAKCKCDLPLCTGEPREPWEMVTHYNDNHCIGGSHAYNMLLLAGESARLLAEQKRKVLVMA